MIHVIATIEATPGKRQQLLTEFHRIVPLVRAEAGCIEYGPTVDVPVALAIPTPVRDDVVVVIEKWDSLDALRAHTTAPHMQEYRVRVKDLVLCVQLQVLQPA